MTKTEQSLQEARVDKEGFLIADEGTHHYLLALHEEAELITISNMVSFLHQLASSFSRGDGEDCLIVRADTHEVVAYYKACSGLQEDWKEEDLEAPQKRAKKFGTRVQAP